MDSVTSKGPEEDPETVWATHPQETWLKVPKTGNRFASPTELLDALRAYGLQGKTVKVTKNGQVDGFIQWYFA